MPKTLFVNKFVWRIGKTGMLVNKPTREHTGSAHLTKNIAVVTECVRKQASISTPGHLQQLGLHFSSES